MTALEAFREEYKGYSHPFERADVILAKMDAGQRTMYFEAIKFIVNSEPFKTEIREWKRGLVETLAMEAKADEREAYRATLLAIKQFEERLVSLAGRLNATTVNEMSKKL